MRGGIRGNKPLPFECLVVECLVEVRVRLRFLCQCWPVVAGLICVLNGAALGHRSGLLCFFAGFPRLRSVFRVPNCARCVRFSLLRLGEVSVNGPGSRTGWMSPRALCLPLALGSPKHTTEATETTTITQDASRRKEGGKEGTRRRPTNVERAEGCGAVGCVPRYLSHFGSRHQPMYQGNAVFNRASHA